MPSATHADAPSPHPCCGRRVTDGGAHRRRLPLTMALLVATVVALLLVGPPTRARADQTAGAQYTDYLQQHGFSPNTGATDPWNFEINECTSFVAWRLNTTNGLPFADPDLLWGDAGHWKAHQESIDPSKVDHIPVRGAIAYWESGHVAWVARVVEGIAHVEEFNSPLGSHSFNERDVHADWYIHLRDLPEPTARPALPDWNFGYDSQSARLRLAPGGSATLWLRLQNTGAATWFRDQAESLRLGTAQVTDRISQFFKGGPGWLGGSRVLLDQQQVRPGEYGTFTFSVTAPKDPGSYQEFFRPVIEGRRWLPDIGIYWSVDVMPADTQPVPVSPANGMSLGTSEPVSLAWSSSDEESFVELWGGPYDRMNFGGWQRRSRLDIGAMWKGSYSWHVKTRRGGVEGPWSPTFTFAVGQPAPSPCSPSSDSVTVYADTNYQGACATVTPERPLADLAAVGLDHIRSLADPGGALAVYLNAGSGFTGRPGVFDQDVPDLAARGWDGSTGSIRVERHKSTACAPASNGIVLFRDTDFRETGGCLFITSDVSDLRPTTFGSGITSVRFVGNFVRRYQLLVYRGANFTDLCGTYWQDQSDLRDCAGRAMSVQVQPFSAPTPVPTPPGTTLAGNLARNAVLNPAAPAVVDGDLSTEWYGGHKFTLGLYFPQLVQIRRIVVWDRKQSDTDNNQINLLTISLSDGSLIANLDMTSGGPRCIDVTFPPRWVSSVVLQPVDASGTNGLREVEVWATTGDQSSNNTCVMRTERTPVGGSLVTPSPIVSATPTPSASPLPTPSPTPTPAPSPSATPLPTASLAPTASPSPALFGSPAPPTPTPQPASPAPTASPVPTAPPTTSPSPSPTAAPTASPSPTPTPAPSSIFGAGEDGDFAGGDPNDVRSALSAAAPSGQMTIPVADSSSFLAGQEIMIWQVQGAGAGAYEYATVGGTGPGSLTVTRGLAHTYTQDGSSRAQVLLVHHYRNVTGSLTTSEWNGSSGGLIVIRARSITNATVDVSQKGFKGGYGNDGAVHGGYVDGVPAICPSVGDGVAQQGSSPAGAGACTYLANGGGGGGATNFGSGGGGGYASNGGDGTGGASTPGRGGIVFGSSDLSTSIFLGTGGGGGTWGTNPYGGGRRSGSERWNDSAGQGGGTAIIFGAQISGLNVSADGAPGGSSNGGYGGGGGSGGAIRIVGDSVSLGSVHATGGAGGAGSTTGGAGGSGRVALP